MWSSDEDDLVVANDDGDDEIDEGYFNLFNDSSLGND